MRDKFKKGAASFYIVAFSTLILVVLATSFALVITSEMARTANDDLSQSAYDSALAGVEDAKVAYSNYRRCKEAGVKAELSTGADVTCGDIVYWVERSPESEKCYTVGRILGKLGKKEESEVGVGGIAKTGSKETTTNQAYTCVKIITSLVDYRATLSKAKTVQTIKLGVGNGSTNDVEKIKFSWYAVRNDYEITRGRYKNFDRDKGVVFPRFKGEDGIATRQLSVPPTMELQIIQTALNFHLADFDIVQHDDVYRTNRATLYLVPTYDKESAQKNEEEDEDDTKRNYRGIYREDKDKNLVTAYQVTKTNNHKVKNKPFLTYCDPESQDEFYCSVEINLPSVILDASHPEDTSRSNATFMLSISLPYQQPDTDFSVEICNSGGHCGIAAIDSGSSSGDIKISNSQIAIDSTGRANDLYRRVETRLETSDTTFYSKYPYYALEILNSPDDTTVKEMKAGYEKSFYF